MIGLLATFVLVLSACAAVDDAAQAQGESAFVPTPTSVGQPVAATDEGAASEGITVHGRWMIEVRDPDGTMVSRTEFDNALTTSGATAMRDLITGSATVSSDPFLGSSWWLLLVDSLALCSVGQTLVQGGCFDVTPAGADLTDLPNGTRLTQSFTMDGLVDPFVIKRVSTWAYVDRGTATPEFEKITEKVLALTERQTVLPNQTVYVEVEISFS